MIDDLDFQLHIDQLKTAIRMEDAAKIIGLKGQGRRFFCPGCQKAGGKTPDLQLYDKGFKCFKCGQGGDIIDLFVLAGRSKADAIAEMESMSGVRRPSKGASKTYGSHKNDRRKTSESRMKDTLTPMKAISPPDDPSKDSKSIEKTMIYKAFLDEVCLPIHSTPGEEYLKGRGIDADIADQCGIRYCPDPSGLWNLADKEIIKAAGLAALYIYQLKKLPFLVFPYIRGGKAVYLKARILLSKEEADGQDIQRFMNTGGRVPCLWNHDAIAGADKVMILEGEMDALTAVQMGHVAVGLPGWSHWKNEWIPEFKGKEVILFLDSDERGQEGSKDIANRFIRSGHPPPRHITLKEGEGKDLNEYFLLTRGKE